MSYAVVKSKCKRKVPFIGDQADDCSDVFGLY